jgi:putative hemolysin
LSKYPTTLIPKKDFAQFLKIKENSIVVSFMMKLLKLDKMNEFYEPVSQLDGNEFIERGFERLGIKYEISKSDLDKTPKEGPFIVTCNHPLGVIDGFTMINVFTKTRPDFKVVADKLFLGVPQIIPHLIIVDAFSDNKIASNASTIKDLLSYVKNGGSIGLFPAGDVSQFSFNNMKVEDKQWSEVLGKIISRLKVPVLPMYCSGRNSILYQIFTKFPNNIRLAKLPSEMLNKKGTVTKIKFGELIQPEEFEKYKSNQELIDFLREKTYSMREN